MGGVLRRVSIGSCRMCPKFFHERKVADSRILGTSEQLSMPAQPSYSSFVFRDIS
jgi:hypothetical protein